MQFIAFRLQIRDFVPKHLVTLDASLVIFFLLSPRPLSVILTKLLWYTYCYLFLSLSGKPSGGQQRRVSFAVSLLHNPELLILDEPTVGVDPMLRQK